MRMYEKKKNPIKHLGTTNTYFGNVCFRSGKGKQFHLVFQEGEVRIIIILTIIIVSVSWINIKAKQNKTKQKQAEKQTEKQKTKKEKKILPSLQM